jgi:hypothetical protein
MSAAVDLSRAPELAPDSLYRIPLVRMMVEDPCVRFRTRAMDHTWKYRRIVNAPLGGFNPAVGAVFVPGRSRIAKWLADPTAPARPLNHGDELVGEVLFAVHDYLHVWAYRAIREACPDLDFEAKGASGKDLEDLVFCHLVTEAVAVVGLDYWYLSTLDLNSVVDLGTMHTTLTVPYHERNIAEYRRFNPSWSAQDVSFFEKLVRAYCTGVFPGFSEGDLAASPMLLDWMRKELLYGCDQRSYARQWFAFLAGVDASPSRAGLVRACACDEPWKQRLVRDIGRMLWAKVKEGEVHTFSATSAVDVTAYDRVGGRLDFRFVNAARFDLEDPAVLARIDHRPESMTWLLRQVVGMHEAPAKLDVALLQRALDTRDLGLVRAVLAGLHLTRVTAEEQGPTLLFQLD